MHVRDGARYGGGPGEPRDGMPRYTNFQSKIRTGSLSGFVLFRRVLGHVRTCKVYCTGKKMVV